MRRGQAPPNNSLKLGKKTNSKPRAEKESIRLSARTGEFTRVSGACNGEFGGIAACNHSLIAQNLSSAEKERSVVAMQQTSLLLRGFPANFSNLTRYAPLLFIFTIKYKHFLRI